MRMCIDCEYNGYLGQLISIALVPESTDIGGVFYQSLGCDNPDEWVAKNVMPIIDIPPVTRKEMQKSLQHFLNQYKSTHIIADWPEDIKYFCELLITGPGYAITTPKLTFEIIDMPDMESISDVPHNALSDARGIARHVFREQADRRFYGESI